jgi:type IV pilus assembly protein PilX
MTCGAPVSTQKPRWLDSGFAGWTDGTAIGTGSLAVTPEYFVEYLGDTFPCSFDPGVGTNDCKRYRVTARAKPTSGRAAVVLQTIYATS